MMFEERVDSDRAMELVLKGREVIEDGIRRYNNEQLASGYFNLANHSEVIHDQTLQDTMFHPLYILIMAYLMGNPIHASSPAILHSWKPPSEAESADPTQRSHGEGNTNTDILDIMLDRRLTFSWEEKDDEHDMQNLEGKLSFFGHGGTTPAPITPVNKSHDTKSPTTTPTGANTADSRRARVILFDVKNVALYYEATDPAITRRSISLDFRVNTSNDAQLELLGRKPLSGSEMEGLTLASLVTSSLIRDYSSHFHRLLFSPNAVKAILAKLDEIED